MARPVCGRSFLPRADKRVSSPKHFRWAPICTTIWYWSSYRRGKLGCRGKLPTRFFVLLQPFPCREIMIIDLFLVALLSFVCLVLTYSSSLVTRLTEECHRSDRERSLEWQTPAVAYPFGSLHDLCVAVVVVLLDEVVRHFRQGLSILLIICHHLYITSNDHSGIGPLLVNKHRLSLKSDPTLEAPNSLGSRPNSSDVCVSDMYRLLKRIFSNTLLLSTCCLPRTFVLRLTDILSKFPYVGS